MKADREKLVGAANEYLRIAYDLENRECPQKSIFMYNHQAKSQINLSKAWQSMLPAGSGSLRMVLQGLRDRRAAVADAVATVATASPAGLTLSDFLPSRSRAAPTRQGRALDREGAGHGGPHAAAVIPAPRHALAPWARPAACAADSAAPRVVEEAVETADSAIGASTSMQDDEQVDTESRSASDTESTCSTVTNHAVDCRRTAAEERSFSEKIGLKIKQDKEAFGVASACLACTKAGLEGVVAWPAESSIAALHQSGTRREKLLLEALCLVIDFGPNPLGARRFECFRNSSLMAEVRNVHTLGSSGSFWVAFSTVDDLGKVRDELGRMPGIAVKPYKMRPTRRECTVRLFNFSMTALRPEELHRKMCQFGEVLNIQPVRYHDEMRQSVVMTCWVEFREPQSALDLVASRRDHFFSGTQKTYRVVDICGTMVNVELDSQAKSDGMSPSSTGHLTLAAGPPAAELAAMVTGPATPVAPFLANIVREAAAERAAEAAAPVTGPPVPAAPSVAGAAAARSADAAATVTGHTSPAASTATRSTALPVDGCEAAHKVQPGEESLAKDLENAVPGLGLAAVEARVLHFPGSEGYVERMLAWIKDNEVALLSEIVECADALVKAAGFKDVAAARLKSALQAVHSKA